jgi:hypothetical protein
VLADHGDPVAVLETGIDHHPAPQLVHARAVGAEDARLRDRRQPAPNPEVEPVERRGAELDQDVVRARLRIRCVFVAEHLRAAVLVDADCLHSRRL